MSRTKKSKFNKKTLIFSILGVIALIIGGAYFSGLIGGGQTDQEMPTYHTAQATEGNLTSSILLSGTIKANEEQHVYYDSTKGDLASVPVNVGDQVQVGQVLASYDATEAQRAYDAAVRALNKIDRQIYTLRTTGYVTTPTPEATGDEEIDASAQASVATANANSQRSYESQLQDLNDSRADAADAVNRAYKTLQDVNVVSTVNGTVVEVNRSVSKGVTNTSQKVVHVVNNSSLVVAGEMSEFNLANIAVDQDVAITSKVYPDQTWTGKVSYISDYPATPNPTGQGTSSASKYPFKVNFTSDLGPLKQGFAVNVQINSNQAGILVPVKAVLTDDKVNYYVFTYDSKTKTVKRVDVQIGGADGANQQITAGLNAGDVVISNPTNDLQDGQEVVISDPAKETSTDDKKQEAEAGDQKQEGEGDGKKAD